MRRHHVWLLAAVTTATLSLVGAAAPPARAGDVPGDTSTRATIDVRAEGNTQGFLETPGDVDLYRVALVEGRDYAVDIGPVTEFPTVFLTLRDPRQRPVKTVTAPSLGDAGFEFRAATTGTYFVEVRYSPEPGAGGSDTYGLNVKPDCRDAASTRCTLRLGRPYNGRSLWSTDRDRFALTLDRSRRYTFTLTTVADFIGVTLEVLDGRGRSIGRAFGSGQVAIRRFKPTASGRHYLRVNAGEDLGDLYTLLATLD